MESQMFNRKFIANVYRALGLRVPTKYLPGRDVEFSAAELAYLDRAYAQDGR